MKREFLKELGIAEDLIDKIMDENGRDIEAEKGKVGSKDKEIELLNNQLKDANKTIKSYKDMDIDKIKESASEWEGKFKEAQKDMENLKNTSALEKALLSVNAHDGDILMKLIDKESLKFTDEGVTGLEEQIKVLQESKPYLFKATNGEQNTDTRFNAHTPPDNDGGNVSGMEAQINSIFNTN